MSNVPALPPGAGPAAAPTSSGSVPDPRRYMDMRPLSAPQCPSACFGALLRKLPTRDPAGRDSKADWLEYVSAELPEEARVNTTDPVLIMALGRLVLSQQERTAVIKFLQGVDQVSLEAVRRRSAR